MEYLEVVSLKYRSPLLRFFVKVDFRPLHNRDFLVPKGFVSLSSFKVQLSQLMQVVELNKLQG